LTLIVDAGVLFAQADADEPRHSAVGQLLREERGPLITSEFATAEADYLILERLGIDVELAFLEDLAATTFQVECLSPAEIGQARSICAQYRDLRIGLSDAALVVLAARFGTTRIATFDERAFRAIKPLTGGAFVVLPG
jgi:predicted nucleic acid-binding protein